MVIAKTKFERGELGDLATIPQALDNQYVPRKVLKNLLRKRLSRAETVDKLAQDIRREYLRSLLYSHRVILNRAFLFNSPVLFGDFEGTGGGREVFLSLLREGVVLPYLYTETSLQEQPAFSVDPKGLEAVKGLVRELGDDLPYVRLSWDARQNVERANQLAKSFTAYALSAPMVAPDVAAELGVKKGKTEAFKARLFEVARFCLEKQQETGQPFITRNQLYEQFVCAPGTRIEEGRYDPTKPFAPELKLLFDLKYNTGLPDALGADVFTARDLPPRAALQELGLSLHGVPDASELDVTELIQAHILGALTPALWLSSIGKLTLADVQSARKTDEFQKFLTATLKLKQSIATAAEGGTVSQEVPFNPWQQAFMSYQERLGKIAAQRLQEKLQPRFEIVLRIAGVAVTLLPEEKVAKFAGAAIQALGNQVAGLVATVTATAMQKRELGVSYDLVRTYIRDARSQCEKLKDRLVAAGYHLSEPPSQEDSATVSPPSEQALQDFTI